MINMSALATNWQLLGNNQNFISTFFFGRSRFRRNRRTHISRIILLLSGPFFSLTQLMQIEAKIPKENIFFRGGDTDRYMDLKIMLECSNFA